MLHCYFQDKQSLQNQNNKESIRQVDPRVPLIENIIRQLVASVQTSTCQAERADTIKEIAWYSNYRSSIINNLGGIIDNKETFAS